MARGGGLIVTVVAGYIGGRCLAFTACTFVVASAALTGVILGVIAQFPSSKLETARWVERVAGGGLIMYVVVATGTDQFAWVRSGRAAIIGVVWLVPLVAGGMYLPRAGYWITSAGCWTVLFGGVAALSYSTSHLRSGMGLFLNSWVS